MWGPSLGHLRLPPLPVEKNDLFAVQENVKVKQPGTSFGKDYVKEEGRDLIKCDFEDFGKKGEIEKETLEKKKIWKK
jgi:hypothetical protein